MFYLFIFVDQTFDWKSLDAIDLFQNTKNAIVKHHLLFVDVRKMLNYSLN